LHGQSLVRGQRQAKKITYRLQEGDSRWATRDRDRREDRPFLRAGNVRCRVLRGSVAVSVERGTSGEWIPLEGEMTLAVEK
jgi:hypothetical protein